MKRSRRRECCIGCRARPNGSTPVPPPPLRKPNASWDFYFRSPTNTLSCRNKQISKTRLWNAPRLLVRMNRTHSASTTCTAMSGNGAKIGTTVRKRVVCCVAAPGMIDAGDCRSAYRIDDSPDTRFGPHWLADSVVVAARGLQAYNLQCYYFTIWCCFSFFFVLRRAAARF